MIQDTSLLDQVNLIHTYTALCHTHTIVVFIYTVFEYVVLMTLWHILIAAVSEVNMKEFKSLIFNSVAKFKHLL